MDYRKIYKYKRIIEKLKFFNPLSTSKGIFKSQGVEAAKKLRASLGYTGKQLYKDIYSEFRKHKFKL